VILGYILVCGYGPLQPNALDGCRVLTQGYTTIQACEKSRLSFMDSFVFPGSTYVDATECLVIGTKV
jgi:hypothetical protein